MDTTKRITRVTFKKFIRDNAEGLHVMRLPGFDGATDFEQSVDRQEFEKIDPAKVNMEARNDFGIRGVWLVGEGMDFFQWYDGDKDAPRRKGFKGIRVSNCCRDFVVAVEA